MKRRLDTPLNLDYTGRMQRWKIPASLLFWLGLLLAACKAPTPPPSPTPWPTATPTRAAAAATAVTPAAATATATSTPAPTPTLPATVLTVWENLSQVQSEALAADVAAFEAEFPNYQVTVEQYTGAQNFMAPLLAGETQFDVTLASPVLLSSLWTAQQLAPMSDFFSAAFMDQFASITLVGASRDDQAWGLPDTAGFHLLLFYNRDLVDRPPASTEELQELGLDLTGPNRWGLAVNSYDPLWLVPWLTAYGGWLTGLDGEPALNTEAMVEALTLFAGWHNGQERIAPVATYEEVRGHFLAGRAAMMIDGEWAITELAQADNINWAAALLPGVGSAADSQPAAPLVLARYWAISRNVTGNRALAAAEFVEFMTRPERQLAWTRRFGLLPTHRAALDDPSIISNPALRTSVEQLRAGRAAPLGTRTNFLLNAMREPLQGVIEGRLTPVQAAEAMQQLTLEK